MSNEPEASMNLDPEMLAAYIDNRLTPEQRGEVEAQLANDPDSYAVLVETIKALDGVTVPELRVVPKAAKARRWTAAAGALALAAALVLIVRLQPALSPWSPPTNGGDVLIARVIDATGDDRFVEARLTGGFKHAPLKSINRGETSRGARQLALRALIDELRTNPAPAGRHALGLALLQAGDHDGAIDALSEAADSSPRVRNDLAAAFIARGKAYDRPADFSQAITACTRALEAEPTLLEARFNRALAQQFIGSPDAPLAWKEYLSYDAASPWAAEARTYLGSR